ncbi:hypothetical protein N1851_017985 [Merluccius polli]|uniref:Uncharacterized protein n=1 Tax=Merluccius polli TaxID=89951 RepID=A0AA47MNR4_MERPO|nr:hypothetical protein N1851_017985 [Merluccius polli]
MVCVSIYWKYLLENYAIEGKKERNQGRKRECNFSFSSITIIAAGYQVVVNLHHEGVVISTRRTAGWNTPFLFDLPPGDLTHMPITLELIIMQAKPEYGAWSSPDWLRGPGGGTGALEGDVWSGAGGARAVAHGATRTSIDVCDEHLSYRIAGQCVAHTGWHHPGGCCTPVVDEVHLSWTCNGLWCTNLCINL